MEAAGSVVRIADRGSGRRLGRWLAASGGGLLFAWALVLSTGRAADAPPEKAPAPAEKPEPPLPLLEQEPFDLITLDASNNNAQLKVRPLMDGARKPPFQIDLNGKYRVRLLDKEGSEYEVLGRNIMRIELFEEMLLKEANRLLTEGQFDEACRYLLHLRSDYPETPGLDASINNYLYLDAFQLTRGKRYADALGIVEELYSRQPGFRYSDTAPTPIEFLSRLVDRIINGYVEQGDYRAARVLLARLDEQYGANKPAAVDQWVQQLQQLATQQGDRAREHLQANRFHEAMLAAKAMVGIWPQAAGSQELFAELARQYPLVTVGVVQPATSYDAQRLDNWAARRTGRLVNRYIVEFLRPGPEGGEYDFPWGLVEHSDDRRQLILRINRGGPESSAITGLDVARRLLDLANPASPECVPAWAALMAGCAVKDVLEVDVSLRRAHVLPEALLRVPQLPAAVGGDSAAPVGTGPFAVAERSESQTRFVTKEFRPGGRLAEISERTFADSQQALGALRRGDIDVLDRLFPADALRAREGLDPNGTLRIEPYMLPTVHLLVPNTSRNPFLAHRDFRRALEFAIDRSEILTAELLGGREVLGCQLISGPFPYGASDTDPLGYAYDASVVPRPYDPRLAKLLTMVAQKQVKEMAAKRGDPPPELAPLVLGHPALETARVACQAMASYWKVIGIECAPREFPPGETRDTDGSCDLVYTEIAIWEPVVDASRLFGLGGIAAADNPYVRQAVRWLEESQSWGEVRERLLALHGAVHNEAAVIPLWQMVDFYAFDTRVRDIGENLVWLYQHVDEWHPSGAAVE